jgi:alpha-galactosidase
MKRRSLRKHALALLAFAVLVLFSIPAFSHQSVRKRNNELPASWIGQLKNAPSRITDAEGKTIDSAEAVVRKVWRGDRCYSSISNRSTHALQLGNIILFDLENSGLDPETPIYGEGFQMLSQTEGSLRTPVDMSQYADRKHYRIPEPDSLRTVYNLLLLDLKTAGQVLLGFASSRRFAGRFSFSASRLQISMDPEKLLLRPGETWTLEEFMVLKGPDRNLLLNRFADELIKNHPPKTVPRIPTGWCSYYFYGTNATKDIITENLKRFSVIMPSLKYIQIDEGYAPTEGDWLEENPAFGSMDSTVINIRKYGFLPALWVAPFIADKDSKLLRDHPDWFVQGDDGKPLNSATKGFGGWRRAPWYCLDGTNPGAQHFLEETFRTMREKWGIRYFKLDANYWGAIAGKHFDPGATRIEAYRKGMEALIRGAGSDAVILGCNAPMWPSLGLVTAMRTSNDIDRSWASFSGTGRENLSRAWQNGRLWINDPDCLLLAGDSTVSSNEWLFHATIIHAVGGMVMDGDRAMDLEDRQMAILKKNIPPAGKGATFSDRHFTVGITKKGGRTCYHIFNWGETPVDRTIKLEENLHLTDAWTGEDLGMHQGNYTIRAVPARSARLIIAGP